VRAFDADSDPVRELASVQDELLLADLASLESGRDKAAKRARGAPEVSAELDVLERAHAFVDSSRPLRDAEFDEGELKLLRGYAPLTLKPQVVVVNVEEGAAAPPELDDAIAISAALEAEVAGMDLDEALELLQGFGVAERGLERVITRSYRALDLITFLTTGEDESRAWEVRRGATAPEAAGQIHSDLQRGFIRAEVVVYDDLVAAGSWAKCKEQGVLRVEGKDYRVKEGDVINVRFAV
jgi:ribosome-binding ATPase YchF (GTP1/OBG family)